MTTEYYWALYDSQKGRLSQEWANKIVTLCPTLESLREYEGAHAIPHQLAVRVTVTYTLAESPQTAQED